MRTLCFATYLEDDTAINVEYTRTPFYPARTYGPPEDCYPAEGGEIEIVAIEAWVDGKWVPYEASSTEIREFMGDLYKITPLDEDGPDPDYEYDRLRDERLEL